MAASRPRTVLLAWEMGADYGHLGRLIPLATALKARGYQPVFACTDLGLAHRIPPDLPVFKSPSLSSRPTDAISQPATLADVLFNSGYCEPYQLGNSVRGWRALYELLNPACVLLDFSPTALIASQGHQHATISIGTGFASPPDVHPLPDIRVFQNHYPDRMQMTEARVVAAVNTQLKNQGVHDLTHLGQLFSRSTANLIASSPALDHYPDRPRTDGNLSQYVGTWGAVSERTFDWPKAQGLRVFAYLKQNRLLSSILKLIRASGHPSVVLVPGLESAERWQSDSMTVVTEPVSIAQVAEEADAAILHAGLSTTDIVLHAGKPVFLLPIHIEQHLTALNVARLGLGSWALMNNASDVGEALSGFFADYPSFLKNAKQFAEDSPFGDREQNLAAAINTITSILDAGSG